MNLKTFLNYLDTSSIFPHKETILYYMFIYSQVTLEGLLSLDQPWLSFGKEGRTTFLPWWKESYSTLPRQPLPGNSGGKASACYALKSICLLCYQNPGFDPWVRKIPLKREWLPTTVILAWRWGAWQATVHGTAKESDMTEWLTHIFGPSTVKSALQNSSSPPPPSPILSGRCWQ